MKIIILYRPNSEHARTTEEFVASLKQKTTPVRIEAVNIDTREGWAVASLYDILQYPAVMVVREDGQLQKYWEGNDLPRIDEVQGYLN